MQREEVRQRIQYLMKHGGLHEAPRDWSRWAAAAAVVSCVIGLVALLSH